MDQNLFGAENLTLKLGQMLNALVKDELPKIKNEVDKKYSGLPDLKDFNFPQEEN